MLRTYQSALSVFTRRSAVLFGANAALWFENGFASVYDGNILKIIDVMFEQVPYEKFLPNAIFNAKSINTAHVDAECFVGIGAVAA